MCWVAWHFARGLRAANGVEGRGSRARLAGRGGTVAVPLGGSEARPPLGGRPGGQHAPALGVCRSPPGGEQLPGRGLLPIGPSASGMARA